MSKKPQQYPIIITNLSEEKEKFFSHPNYNPKFEYDRPGVLERLSIFGQPDNSLFEYSKELIHKALFDHGSLDNFHHMEGEILSFDETKYYFENYIKDNNVANMVEMAYFGSQAARTTTFLREDLKIIIQTKIPVSYRENSIQAVLDHEVGTHAFRWINELAQPWYNNEMRYDFRPHLKTEEGLATLHWLFSHPIETPLQQAIYYYVVYRALSLSFAELYQEVFEMIHDEELAWFFAVRAKRGLTDTSLPGGCTKDIVYLEGVREVSEWLDKNNYDVSPLYLGKIALDDVESCLSINGVEEPLLPKFITDSAYSEKIAEVIEKNGFLNIR